MNTSESGVAPPLAGRREWIGLVVLAIPTMLAMMDINVLFLALPHLSTDLGATSTEQLWITDIYGFLIAGFLVTMGTLGDRLGRRNVLIAGATAFGVLSAIAAFSTSPEMLIAIRALLGIAGATIMPSTLALIMSMFPDPKQMGAAIGVWATAMMAGVALGPVVGGLLLASFWWGSVFLLAVPVMLLVVVTGPFLLPDSRNPDAGRIDLFSVVLSLAALLPVIYGLKEMARSGWAAVPAVVLVVGVVFGVLFVYRQRRLRTPLLDIGLFGIPAVSGALILGLLFATIQAGTGLLMTQHLQLVEGFSPLVAALWLLIPAVAMVVGIQLTTPLAKRIRPAAVLVVGMLIAAIGMLVLTRVDASGGLPLLVSGASIVFIGGSPIGVLVNQLVMQSAPPERAGSAASLQSTGGELGSALGIAALGSLAAAVYHTKIRVPGSIPTAAGDAARESVAGAVSTASRFPGAAGEELLDSAEEAFTSSLNITAGVCAAVFLGLAVLAFASLRHIAATGAPQGSSEPAPDAGSDSGASAAQP
ncbi:MFS transporter, DHA2 family, multidrug resistance protein [Actinopolyspora mzabensis]|uniref:MFS transporter, DHA2 family, multidrug resistance protein n=1 Tax=Actinopolyspora mzabensis TaxID=995066 RepID=A0A1G8Y6B6_ACTMZ|nr:MFS transporter [Actinopolyspora mzabensis]SDJ98177.1 MFS transporter, DHA2 family, multidrug resistance protein [Actinopolyspora mzabensis]